MTSPRVSLPRVLLHVEGAALLALVVFLYAKNDESWILFAVLLLAPGVGMLGYVANRRVGAWAYNVFQAYPLPALVAAVGVRASSTPTDFKDTHLDRV